MSFNIFTRDEKKGIIFLTIILFLTLFFLTSSIYSFLPFNEKYSVLKINYNTKTINGINNINITENYDIIPGINNYHVLYRSFNDKICYENECYNLFDIIKIKNVDCKIGKPYISTQNKIYNPKTKKEYSKNEIPSIIKNKIYSNEVGCFLQQGFSKKENLKIQYTTETKKNIHFLFSKEHFPINKLIIEGNYNDKKFKKEYSFIPRNIPIKINIKDGTLNTYYFPLSLVLILIILFSLIPYWLWNNFGLDKKIYVPKYLHTIPDKNLEYWKVDVLTNNNPLKNSLSKNGVASLIMELYVNKILDFKKEKGKKYFILYKNKEENLNNVSSLAKKFYNLLLQFKIKEENGKVYSKIPEDSQKMRRFLVNEEVKNFKIKDYKGAYYFLSYTSIFLIIIYFLFQLNILGSSIISTITILTVIFLFFSFYYFLKLFSKYKQDYYKKYLEWIAFKNMLSDFAKIKKYFKEDYQQWKEWLLYGTALGETKNILKAMKGLNLIPEEEYKKINAMHAYALTSIASSVTSKSSSSSLGGGGFGGGGGGGR